MRVLFDVGGNGRAGVGHVIRSIELATRLLQRGMQVNFLAPRGPTAARMISELSFARVSGADVLSDGSPTLVVVDRPDTTQARLGWYRKRWSSAVLFVLDYYGAPVDGVATVVNLNRWRGSNSSGWGGACDYRAGLRFAIVRRSFRRLRRARTRAASSVKRVFIGFGGTDPHGWTLGALKALSPLLDRGLRFEVVVGTPSAVVGRYARAIGGKGVRINVKVADPAPLLSGCDLAVIGGGTTMVEAACLGVPAVVVPRTSAERLFAREFSEAGAVRVVQAARGFPGRRVLRTVTELQNDWAARRRMAVAGRRLIDGQGADRVIELVLQAWCKAS